MAEPVVTLTDMPDAAAMAAIQEGLSNYNEAQAGYRDAKQIGVFVSDPETGEVIGGLYGRSSLGTMIVDRFFLPEGLRRDRLGSRLLAMAEDEGRRRGCSVIALFTLHFQAPGFYQKQGYEIAAKLEPAPGTTRYLMRKRL